MANEINVFDEHIKKLIIISLATEEEGGERTKLESKIVCGALNPSPIFRFLANNILAPGFSKES